MGNQLGIDFAPQTGLIAGVDEVGRGPLAGAVVAAAVILDPNRRINGLRDSKILTEEQREALDERIRAKALAVALGRAEVEEIDEINILQATLLAMRRAVLLLPIQPDFVYVDGNQCPRLPCPVEAVIKGDGKVKAISAASIVAKVARDREMREMDKLYPGYDFASNKGYGTPAHYAGLAELGVTPIHRRSFAPVREALSGRETANER